MAAPLLERLRAALDGRYVVERELGHGGMALVFLAQDLKHHRPVAIKVLRPELAAALGAERFLREIEIAARLTHPHILAVHDSGEAGGLLYYVMPYVEGESLRERLTREKQLPVDDAVQITRQVADALGYAHSHNVVHRDIKPENILLGAGHPVVADFGIARAITAAGGDRLTTTGISVGTPAYMSPEQGAGEPVDGRTDVYSLGCVLYEMLAGEPPYTGATAQAIQARRLTDPVPPLRTVRETVPAHLEQAIVKALAKVPADRCATADQFSDALAAADVQRPLPARRFVWAGAVAAIAIVLLAVSGGRWFLRTSGAGTLIGKGALGRGDLVLLADFRNQTGDSTLADVVSEALRAALADLRLVRLIDPATVRDALARMGQPSGTKLFGDVARELAEREHATALVTGDLSPLGSGYQFSLRVVGVADGRILQVERVAARSEDEVIRALDRLAGGLRRDIGESVRDAWMRPELMRVTTPSLAALRSFSRGVRVYMAGRPDSEALAFVREAIARDSEFAAAYRFASRIESNSGHVAEAVEALDRAYRFRARLPESERLMVESDVYKTAGDLEKARMTLRSVLDMDPNHVAAIGVLSDLNLHQHRWTEAESLALRVLDFHPQSWIAVYNAIEAQLASGRLAAAESLLQRVPLPPQDRAEAFLSTDPMREFGIGLVFAKRDWHALGAYADSLDPTGVALLSVFSGRLRGVEGQGAALPMAVRARLPLYVLRYRGDTSGARRLIAQWRVDAGLESRPPDGGSYRILIRFFAEAGQIAEARRLLREWTTRNPRDPWIRAELNGALGAIALGEGQFDSAATHFIAWHAAPYAGGGHETNRGLVEAGMALDRAGRPDSAMALFERALAQPAWYQPEYEAEWYPIVLRRLGELYETRGYRARAIDYYSRFVELWRDADADLQPRVTETRRRIARLASEQALEPR